MHRKLSLFLAATIMMASSTRALLSRTTASTTRRSLKHLRPTNAYNLQRSRKRTFWLTATTTLFATAGAANGAPQPSACTPSSSFFPSDILVEDFYNGVTIRLDLADDTANPDLTTSFEEKLTKSLELWNSEGRKGIWIHCPLEHADIVPIAKNLGFAFHLVANDKLVLSKWLPDSESRLPNGPNHQIGVGCFVPHPTDPNQMLVVQEQTGPAAAYGLWKMPTGLADAGEDIHKAAERELLEETNLAASFDGILVFRQAHPAAQSTRTVSDLFFVCKMKLNSDSADFQADDTEIKAIRWMPIQEYCDQDRWQTSPVYMELNRALLESSKRKLFHGQTLELGFENQLGKGTNSIYMGEHE